MVDWREANVHVLTHTLHYGVGVFEGVRAYNTPKGPSIFRLQDHTDRLFKSAGIVNMEIPYAKETINNAHIDVVNLNNLEESYIRPMCFYGSEGMGLRADNLKVHTMVAAWEWPSYMEPEAKEKGIKVKVSSYKRQVRNPVSSAKVNGNYVNSIVALNEALEAGFDEALMLDEEENVAEGSGENFFIVKNGILKTPDLEASLDGITRRTIIQLAKDMGMEVEIKKIKLHDVLESDEAFFTGTAAEVVPINSVNNESLGNGSRGPITEILQSTYFDQVRGLRDENSNWHSYVR
ncbi:MAG TPA: branched-chain amino acid transaminase [Gammaproteobacteria bacterium]|nr:branched-chain amino acid transaminase [Gammaproteobacteria bacterium]HIK73046.1 branched-chain amino acid transaminase [Gammaproteobacteria bacterium]